MTPLKRRLQKLEDAHGKGAERIYTIEVPDGYDEDRALEELGVSEDAGLVIFLRRFGQDADMRPKLLSASAPQKAPSSYG